MTPHNVLIDAASGRMIATNLAHATTWWARFRGLMLRAPLPEGAGLLIEPCGSIHMMFMRFPIDAVFYDADLRVTKVARRLRPWIGIATGGRGAKGVIELPAGAANGLEPGAQLRLSEGLATLPAA